jgi:hypothetical protein
MDITTAYCKKCKTIFKLSSADKKWLTAELKAGATSALLECTNCEGSVAWKLSDVPKIKPTQIIRCPKLFCPGYVTQDSKKIKKTMLTYWGCSECLGKWRTQKSLEEEISRTVKKYPHRKKIYKKGKDGHWKPVHPEPWKLHEWYEEKLETVEMADYEKNIAAQNAASSKDVFRCTCLACPGHLIPYSKTDLEKRFKIKAFQKQWVCTDCNTVFKTRKAIEAEIETLTVKYPHRKLAYKKKKEGWQAVAMQQKKTLEYEQALWNVESFDLE